MRTWIGAGLCLLLMAGVAGAAEPEAGALPVHVARYGAGEGPREEAGVWHLLDDVDTPRQSNAIAFDREHEGARSSFVLEARLRVLEGGDGGAFAFLATDRHGVRGPAPFAADWAAPTFGGAFVVAIDVHDPPTDEPFGPLGNVLGLPEREVSLHWDGRELVKRLAPEEFRGAWTDVRIAVEHVTGGAEVSVRLGDGVVYDHEFVPGLDPFEQRLAIGASTRADVATRFDVADLQGVAGPRAPRPRPPLHLEVFHHVRTDNTVTAHEAEVDLPPADWSFGRVILHLELHDAGDAWDEWDRNGEVSVFDDDGRKLGIVPFITSYRTPCRWDVDVTHFRPLLTGRRRFEIAAGTTFYKNRGYLMSVSLDFHHGSLDAEPYRVHPLWHGTARHGSDENHFQDAFAPQDVAIDAEATAVRFVMTTTGHSQVGEFTPADRTLVVAPEAAAPEADVVRFDHRLWKTDCYLNPNRPQFGTWKYPRAGWAPGDVVRPWRLDLGPHLRPGTVARFDYEPHPYVFPADEERPTPAQVAEASHVVRAYLILYRAPGAPTPAPTVRVLGVDGGSPAAAAGLQAGDWLATYDGIRLDTVEDLRQALRAALAGGRTSVAITAWRGARRLDVTVAPGRLGVQLSGP